MPDSDSWPVVELDTEAQAASMIPEDEAFTTQAAANFLGMARASFVNLLEQGRIPFFTVEAHRRVRYRDLLEFRADRDAKRSQALDQLAKEIEDAGF